MIEGHIEADIIVLVYFALSGFIGAPLSFLLLSILCKLSELMFICQAHVLGANSFMGAILVTIYIGVQTVSL